MVRRTGEFLTTHSLADSTKKMYAAAWERFQRYSSSLQPPLPHLPATPLLILDYIRHMSDTQWESSSRRQFALSAISFFHKSAQQDPTVHPWVKVATRNLHRTHPATDSRTPVTLPILHRIIDACDRLDVNQHKVDMLKAMFSTMFHGFLHIGEVTLSQHTLQHSDLHLDDNATITFRTYKHHKGSPVSLTITAQPDDSYCPVMFLTKILSRGDSQGPLFQWPDQGGLHSLLSGCFYTGPSRRLV